MATVPYQLAVDGVSALRVHSLRGKEALSEAWHFDVVVSGASAEETERLALGQRATLVLDAGGDKPRALHDDTSSCWIHNMQAWGGSSWGHQFIPRVGMEVIVVFEGGDPDKPIVLGSVYNETHPAAFKLPEQKTKSGIRTQTSPGGNGFNELSFDDAAGAEQVYIHAQRDMTEMIERNMDTNVRLSSTTPTFAA